MKAAAAAFKTEIETQEHYVIIVGKEVYATCDTEDELASFVNELDSGTQFVVEHRININDRIAAIVKRHEARDKRILRNLFKGVPA